MSKKKISIIMSVFNHEKTLKNSIESIINQSYQNIELIIINDGSTDNSKKIITKLKIKNPNIKFYNFKKNLGLAKRLNFAISISKGEYIARMDADDFSSKNRLQKQYKFLIKNPSYDVVGSNATYIDRSQNYLRKTKLNLEYKILKKNIFKKNQFIHSSIMATRNFFLKNKYDVSFNRCQDYELWIRTINNYKFKNLKANLIIRTEFNKYEFKTLKYSILSRFKHRNKYSIIDVIFNSSFEILYFFLLKIKNFF